MNIFSLHSSGDRWYEQICVDFVDGAFNINFLNALKFQEIENVAGAIPDDQCNQKSNDDCVHVADSVEVEVAVGKKTVSYISTPIISFTKPWASRHF